MLGYIEFENVAKLGNLKLDFFKNDKEVYNTIVLAGENGCGKTAVLEEIAKFQQGGYLRKYSTVKKVMYVDERGECHTISREEEEGEYDDLDFYTEQDFLGEQVEIEEQMPYDIRNNKLVFSEARSGFEVNLKENVCKNDYEEISYEKNGADYSGFVQMLIDIEERDNEEYIRYAKFNPECTYAQYMSSNSRIVKFKRAYEGMFEKLLYMGKDPRRKEHTIYFKKGERQIDVSELSTGEQQIVFRGADLLYNSKNDATIIIDEPELSLHPKWQMNILDFYKNLFTDENGKQNVQLIIATHSQYVVRAAMDHDDDTKVIILEREGSEVKANVMEKTVLGRYSSAEINYLAFGVEKVEYHIQLFGALHSILQDIHESGVSHSISSIDQYISKYALYDPLKHEREDKEYHYYTLPVYIRNAIDHPENDARQYNDSDLEESINLLRNIYGEAKAVLERETRGA